MSIKDMTEFYFLLSGKRGSSTCFKSVRMLSSSTCSLCKSILLAAFNLILYLTATTRNNVASRKSDIGRTTTNEYTVVVVVVVGVVVVRFVNAVALINVNVNPGDGKNSIFVVFVRSFNVVVRAVVVAVDVLPRKHWGGVDH